MIGSDPGVAVPAGAPPWGGVLATCGGPVAATKTLNSCRVSPSKTFSGLSERQRAELAGRTGPVLGRANIAYELSERTKGTAHGGIGAIAKLVDACGLAGEIDASLDLLKLHKPYYESDHVLNIAYNALCGGQRLEDIEARRCDAVFLDGLGTQSLPDPTTAGDFCRRFDPDAVLALQEAINRARLKVWRGQPDAFFAQPAVIDADASIVPTDAATKQRPAASGEHPNGLVPRSYPGFGEGKEQELAG